MELKRNRRCSFAKTTHNIKDDDEHNQHESGSRLWPITCGTKNGLLHVERLKRGEMCIHCEGCWFTPNDFEKLGGKGSAKKWKATIFHKEKSLEFFLKEGVLSTEGYTGRPRTKKNTSLPSNCEPGDLELPSRERRKAANTACRHVESLRLCLEDSSDDDDDDDDDRYLGSREQVMLTEEEENDSDEEEGINMGDAESEEDEEEWSESEDEDVLTDMDQSADEAPTKELDPKMIISTPRIFQPKVLLKRLLMGDCQTISLKHPTEGISTAAPRFLVGIYRDDDDDSAQMTPETCHNPNNLGPSSLLLASSCHTASTEGQGQKGNKKQQEAKAYLDRTARRRVEAREKRCERREVQMSESLKRIATALELLSSKLDTVITLLQRLTDQK